MNIYMFEYIFLDKTIKLNLSFFPQFLYILITRLPVKKKKWTKNCFNWILQQFFFVVTLFGFSRIFIAFIYSMSFIFLLFLPGFNILFDVSSAHKINIIVWLFAVFFSFQNKRENIRTKKNKCVVKLNVLIHFTSSFIYSI